MLPILGLVEVRRAWEISQSAMQRAVGLRPVPCTSSGHAGGFQPVSIVAVLSAPQPIGLHVPYGLEFLTMGCAAPMRAAYMSTDFGCLREFIPGQQLLSEKNGHPTRFAAGACRIRKQATPRTFARLPVTLNTVADNRLFHVSTHRLLSFPRANARGRLTLGSAGRWRAGARPAGADTGPTGRSPLRV
jgi:hypothetical protein